MLHPELTPARFGVKYNLGIKRAMGRRSDLRDPDKGYNGLR